MSMPRLRNLGWKEHFEQSSSHESTIQWQVAHRSVVLPPPSTSKTLSLSLKHTHKQSLLLLPLAALGAHSPAFWFYRFAYFKYFMPVELSNRRLCGWLLSLSIVFSLVLHVVLCISLYSFHGCILFHCMARPPFVYPFIHG